MLQPLLLLTLLAAATAASTPQHAALQLLQRQRLARFDGLLAQLMLLLGHSEAGAAERLLASYAQQQAPVNALDDAALLMAAGGEAQLPMSSPARPDRDDSLPAASNASLPAARGTGSLRALLSSEPAAHATGPAAVSSSATTTATLTGDLGSLGDVRAAAMNTLQRHAAGTAAASREVQLPTDEAPPFRIVGGVQAPKGRWARVCTLVRACMCACAGLCQLPVLRNTLPCTLTLRPDTRGSARSKQRTPPCSTSADAV